MFINTITFKRYPTDRLASIPGNIIHRGLSHEFIPINTIAIEYSRLLTQLQHHKSLNLDTTNTLIAINDLYKALSCKLY